MSSSPDSPLALSSFLLPTSQLTTFLAGCVSICVVQDDTKLPGLPRTMTSVATSFSGAATNYCGVWMNKCMVFLHLSMHYETYNASTTEPDWGGISNQQRIWTSCAGTEVHTQNLSLHNNSNLPGPKWIVNAWCRLHLKFAADGIYRPELKITSHWLPKTSVLTQYNSTPKWSETAPGPLGGSKKTFRPSIRFSNADVPLNLILRLGHNATQLGAARSIQLNSELQPTELGFKYPYNPDDFCLEIQVQSNTNSASTCLAMAWVTIYWVSAPQLNPIRPETRLIFDSKIPPSHKIQQRRVRTAQPEPNVDSPPRTHKITRTRLHLRRTNASSAPASLDEAEIKSSLIWIAFFAPSTHQVLKQLRRWPTTDSGQDAAGCELCGSVQRAQTPKRVRETGRRAHTRPAQLPLARGRAAPSASLGQKVCGGARRGYEGWRKEMVGGWEEKRRCGATGEKGERGRDAEQRSAGRSPRPHAPPVREQDLRRGARDSTRMRSCVPAEREFAQTAIGADSARAGAACVRTRAGDDEEYGDDEGRWGHEMVQCGAGIRRAHECIPAEYGQTESSAVRTRLNGAGVRRCTRGRGRRAKGRKEGEAGRRRARGREGDGGGMQIKTREGGSEVLALALKRQGWSGFDRCERVASRHVSARASGSVCVRVGGGGGGGWKGGRWKGKEGEGSGARLRNAQPRTQRARRCDGEAARAGTSPRIVRGLGSRLPPSPHAGTQHPRALIYPHRGRLRQRRRDLVSLPQSTATARAGCGWGAAHEGGDGEGCGAAKEGDGDDGGDAMQKKK
ncbi:hypothetical protein C8F04DRAFT_1310775 [Mycena alexandri]|uniref:Uncharacterized protein n=1 Tax=Mycena alexandri TaxID=1745969 RepID=A0AAD6S796_9AGAR|nr:hypothetical protein C8F04DRAFT_1310775 [Mycena alexandri]